MEEPEEERALCPVSGTLNGKCKVVSILVLSRLRPPLLNLETGQGRPPDAESDGLPKKAVPQLGKHCQELVHRHHAHHAIL